MPEARWPRKWQRREDVGAEAPVAPLYSGRAERWLEDEEVLVWDRHRIKRSDCSSARWQLHWRFSLPPEPLPVISRRANQFHGNGWKSPLERQHYKSWACQLKAPSEQSLPRFTWRWWLRRPHREFYIYFFLISVNHTCNWKWEWEAVLSLDFLSLCPQNGLVLSRCISYLAGSKGAG